MRLWRIAAETRAYRADDLSGTGAAINPGRWNDHDQRVIYAAPTIAIAVLETAAYLRDGGLPLNRFLIAIDVPDAVWARREAREATALPTAWAAIPAGAASISIGSAWLRSKGSAILLLPSVMVPEESVALINPGHPDAASMTASVVRPVSYATLFRSR